MTDAERERAAVVAWAWREADELDRAAKHHGGNGDYHTAAKFAEQATDLRRFAHRIERGEHLRGGE